ncbi:MAG: hypothetical protein SVS85_04080 [Candidatus Nanohaloarchaea archaeon]|nr:hypothetical protein [Candidatus Nanohaloarchaea archaeon]
MVQKTGEEIDELFAERLVEAGYSDFYIMDQDAARRVLTERRLEIIGFLRKNEASSIRGLARNLGRDVKSVHHDLGVLFENGVIDFEEEADRKIPVVPFKRIFVRPL